MIFEKRKGISTFIATLLLMVLAVSAGVVIYAYTMGYLGGFGGPQTLGSISMDTYALNATAGSGLHAWIRNIGKAEFVLDRVYVNGVYQSSATLANISEGLVKELTIPFHKLTPATGYFFRASTTYEIKLIGKDNTQLSFQVKK
jgi:hypothetical protein